MRLSRGAANTFAARSEADGIRILAGVNRDGEGAVLVFAFQSELDMLTLRWSGVGADRLTVRCIDAAHDLEPVDCTLLEDGVRIPKPPGSAVFLIEGLKRTV